MKRFLALDLGAESGRAILGSVNGERLELEELHRFPNDPVHLRDGIYWDTLRLFFEMRHGLDVAMRERRLAISSVGVDTWGVDFGFLAGDGSLVANPHHYRDPRNNGQMEKVFQQVSRDAIYAETGLQFMQINSLFQWYAMKSSPAVQVAKTLLFMPDLFNYLFCGVARTDRTIASTSQFYNPVERCFCGGLLQALGLDPSILPEIVDPPHILGLDFETHIPVCVVGGHDTASAVAAVPVQSSEPWCYISSGTWSLMGAEWPEAIINARSAEFNFTNEIGIGGRVRLLKNIAGLWLWQELRRAWINEGITYSYDEMAQMAAAARPFSAVIHPDAFLEPGVMPELIAAHCQANGQTPPQTHGEFCRAVLEGLALRYRQVLEHLELLTGRSIHRIHIVGGGSRNAVLNQFAADATGRDVVAGPTEATATGNILVQAMGAGLVSSLEELRHIVAKSFAVTTIRPGRRTGWDEAYGRFRGLSIS